MDPHPKKTTDTLPAVLIFRPVEVLLIGEYGFRMRFRTGQAHKTGQATRVVRYWVLDGIEGQTIVKTDCRCIPSELVQRRLIFVSLPF